MMPFGKWGFRKKRQVPPKSIPEEESGEGEENLEQQQLTSQVVAADEENGDASSSSACEDEGEDATEENQGLCSSRALRIIRNILQYSLLLALTALLILWIGAEIQDRKASAAKGTAHFYETENVCAMELPEVLLEAQRSNSTTEAVDLDIPKTSYYFDPIIIKTLANETEASDNNTTIATCGQCGKCSNPHDIKIYDDTKTTLFDDSFACSKRGLFGGVRTTRKCMKERVGFTTGCSGKSQTEINLISSCLSLLICHSHSVFYRIDCWAKNIQCSIRKCAFTCMWHAIFSEVNSDSDNPQALNRCTRCDEKVR